MRKVKLIKKGSHNHILHTQPEEEKIHTEMQPQPIDSEAVVKKIHPFFGKLIALGIIILLYLLMSYGINQTRSQQSSNVINPGELKAQAEARTEAIIEHVKIEKRDYLRRMYQDGLIFEDYSKTKERLDTEYKAFLEKGLKDIIKEPFFIKVRTTYFQDSLKKATEENLGIDYMLAEDMQGVAESVILLYQFEG